MKSIFDDKKRAEAPYKYPSVGPHARLKERIIGNLDVAKLKLKEAEFQSLEIELGIFPFYRYR